MSEKETATELGYQHGLIGENKNPYIPADEWNHDGNLHSWYERGFSQGVENVKFMAEALSKNSAATSPQAFMPTLGIPVWCSCEWAKFDGWALVTKINVKPLDAATNDYINVLTSHNGEPLEFTTNKFWERRPPLEQLEVKLIDDDGDEFVVGYGEYADLNDSAKFDKLFYVTSGKEEITIPLSNVAPLLEAIKKVSRQ